MKDNNNIILLKKLIDDTQTNKINWVKSDKMTAGWYSYHDTWKGEKIITHDKRLAFILNYDTNNISYAEIRVFFINNSIQTREQIADVEPGFFGWKTQKWLKKLINAIKEKKKEQDACRLRTIIGPMPAKNFDEVIY